MSLRAAPTAPGSGRPSAIIVGAGVLGATLAHRLTRDGWSVTVIDQHPVGTLLGSSGGVSRLIRFAHGDSVADARAAWQSLQHWRELERLTDTPLLTTAGVAWLAGDDDRWERASQAVLERLEIPVQKVELDRRGDLFPELSADDLRYLLFEPAAALIAAQTALRALIEDAVGRGAVLVRARAQRDRTGVVADGERLRADQIIWAVGCWTAQMFGELLQASVVQQDTYYFGADRRWRCPPTPAFSDARTQITGAGDVNGAGIKLGLHEDGPPLALDHDRTPDPLLASHARTYLSRRFPSLADAPLVSVEVQHTAHVRWSPAVEPETVIAGVPLVRVPNQTGCWILGDGSGSVFKTAPLVAASVAARLGRG